MTDSEVDPEADPGDRRGAPAGSSAAARRGQAATAGPATLAELLRELRRRALLTQEELASRSGLSVGTVRGLESGRIRRPRSGSVRLLAGALAASDRDRDRLVAAAQGGTTTAGGQGPAPETLVPSQLPAAVAGFTGRAEALKALDERLPDETGTSPAPVVISAIAGTAGVGKTALAVHWAHRVANRFPEGQLYLNLRGYTTGPPLTPGAALAVLLRGLGVVPDEIPAGEAEAAARYRSLLAGRRMLILLDNARTADQIRPLLPGSPGCLVVVTSRDRLSGLVARDGAHRLVLDVLSPDEALGLLAAVIGRDRVEAEPAAAAELAAACSYLPLALRITAVRLADRPHRRLAEHVAELTAASRLAALAVGGDQDSTVRGAFDLSYGSIPDPERRLFRLLGLVPGTDVTAEAAAALAGQPARVARGLLDRLAAAHLVHEHVADRYTLHDLLRAYARERARVDGAGADHDAALRRLSDWYLHTADVAGRLVNPLTARLPPGDDPSTWPPAALDDRNAALAWLDAERSNLVAAVLSAAEHGPRPLAWRLTDAIRCYFWVRMDGTEGLAIGRASLAAAGAEGDLAGQAAAHLTLAGAFTRRGEHAKAMRHYTEAADLTRRAGWVAGEAAASNNLGIVFLDAGEPRRAASSFRRAVDLNRRLGLRAPQAANLSGLAEAEQERGRLREASDWYAESRAICREVGNDRGEAAEMAGLGEVQHLLGRFDQARDHLGPALARLRASGYRGATGRALRALAALCRDTGDLRQALDHVTESLTLARATGERRDEAKALVTLGTVQLALGRPDDAIASHELALGLAGDTIRSARAGALTELAAALAERDLPAAAERAEQAIDLARACGYGLLEGAARTTLAGIRLQQGDHDKAAALAREALEIHRTAGHRLGQARALAVLGDAHQAAGAPEVARSHWREASGILTDLGSPDAGRLASLL